MKSKTLITMAVASTIGLSAAAFAGTGPEAVAPDEFGNVGVTQEYLTTQDSMGIGSTWSDAVGSVTGSSEGFGSLDPSASFSSDEDWMAAAHEGIYSDFYLVGFSPTLDDNWEYYLIDSDSERLAFTEPAYFLMPSYEVFLMEDMSQDIASDLGE